MNPRAMKEENARLSAKLRFALLQARQIPRALQLVWSASPGWTCIWASLLVVQTAPPVAMLFLTRQLVDTLVRTSGDSGVEASALYFPIGILAALLLLSEALRSVSTYVSTLHATLLQDYVHSLVHRQAGSVDMAFYDLPEYFDHLHRAQSDASYRPVALVQSLGGTVQHGLTLVAMTTVLLQFGLFLPLAILVSTVPAFIALVRYTHRQHTWRREATSEERRARYYSCLLTSRESAAEVRLFSLADTLRQRFESIRDWLRTGERRLAGHQLLTEIAASAASMILLGVAVGWSVLRTLDGTLTLGELAMFYQALIQGQRVIGAMLHQASQVYYNSLFLGNLFEYLALRPSILSPENPQVFPSIIRSGLRLSGVTFNYPGSTRQVLRELDLEVPVGSMVAIVGANGAGKSTLTKLLLRFFDPTAGHITLDGTDLREFSLDELRRAFAVLFQQPLQFNATLRENIAWGDVELSASQSAIEQAALDAGLGDIVRQLPNGFEQTLGKWFVDGTDLSVGQWQRVALARAFLRKAPFLVLDEPTSAMDPWNEAEWLGRFRRLAKARTTLVITHRFTTAVHADTIHVMHQGRIIESGSHDELLRLGGRYAAGWLSTGYSTDYLTEIGTQ